LKGKNFALRADGSETHPPQAAGPQAFERQPAIPATKQLTLTPRVHAVFTLSPYRLLFNPQYDSWTSAGFCFFDFEWISTPPDLQLNGASLGLESDADQLG